MNRTGNDKAEFVNALGEGYNRMDHETHMHGRSLTPKNVLVGYHNVSSEGMGQFV